MQKFFPMNTNKFAGGTKNPANLKKLSQVRRANGDNLSVSALLDDTMIGDSFDVAITNELDKEVTLALTPGFLSGTDDLKIVAGITVDAIMKHGTNLQSEGKNVTVDCPKLAFLQQYLRANAIRINEIQMQVNDQKYFKYPLTLVQFDLISAGRQMPIKPTDFVNEANHNTNLIHMSRKDGSEWQMDGNRILIIKVGPKEEVTFSFQFGTCASVAEFLANAANALNA